jgi:hypothetical protein
MVAEPAIKNLKKGEIIQFQRKGFFICDQEYQEKSPYTGSEVHMILIEIPSSKT